MKTRIFMLAVMAFVMSGMMQLSAQNFKEKKVTKDTVLFAVPMDCEGCRTKIVSYMSYEKGVRTIHADLSEQTVNIIYNPQKTTIDKLIQAFAKIDKKAVEWKEGEERPAGAGHHHSHDHHHHH